MKYELLLLLLLFALARASELTRCCSGGARHFRQMSTCSRIRTEGSGVSCTRAASICCLRALLDKNCDQGSVIAETTGSCDINVNNIGGGIRKECCDCCMLAKDLSRQNRECAPPAGFSAACLNSFKKCCSREHRPRQYPRVIHAPRAESESIVQAEDRCATARCKHSCTDLGGEHVECSCKDGYDLAPDGFSCIDIDECALMDRGILVRRGLRLPIEKCNENEICENLPGGYRCYPIETPQLTDLTGSEWEEERTTTFGPPVYDVVDRIHSEERTHELVEPVNPPGLDGIADVAVPDEPEESGVLAESAHSVRYVGQGQVAQNGPEAPTAGGISCPDGWTISDAGTCVDVDECNLGSHDCGPLYQCRNTQGSYRCDPKTCPEGQIMSPQTGECSAIDCPIGYRPSENGCVDVNECEIPGRCRQFEECINTPGSYRCQERGNLCTTGFQMDRNTGFCIDIDECTEGIHTCEDKPCINLIGSYKCRCPAGFDFNETTMHCEDVDECKKYSGHVCSLQATCQNTHGSFKCICNAGFKLADDNRNCEDIDECQLGIAKCAQRCVNIPGSYQCICERGYQLGTDGVTCEDTDECALWAGVDDLCMGECINTPGSFKCDCPPGYQLQADGRTCTDVDECQKGECQGADKICVNTLGSYKCQYVECPENYVHDKNYKNYIIDGYSCLKRCHPQNAVCIGNHTKEILYQFRSLPTITEVPEPIEVSKVQAQMDENFSVHYKIDRRNKDKFLIEQREKDGIVKLKAPLIGPSTEVVRVHINTYSRSHVLLAHNVAVITIYVSDFAF